MIEWVIANIIPWISSREKFQRVVQRLRQRFLSSGLSVQVRRKTERNILSALDQSFIPDQ